MIFHFPVRCVVRFLSDDFQVSEHLFGEVFVYTFCFYRECTVSTSTLETSREAEPPLCLFCFFCPCLSMPPAGTGSRPKGRLTPVFLCTPWRSLRRPGRRLGHPGNVLWTFPGQGAQRRSKGLGVELWRNGKVGAALPRPLAPAMPADRRSLRDLMPLSVFLPCRPFFGFAGQFFCGPGRPKPLLERVSGIWASLFLQVQIPVFCAFGNGLFGKNGFLPENCPIYGQIFSSIWTWRRGPMETKSKLLVAANGLDFLEKLEFLDLFFARFPASRRVCLPALFFAQHAVRFSAPGRAAFFFCYCRSPLRRAPRFPVCRFRPCRVCGCVPGAVFTGRIR